MVKKSKIETAKTLDDLLKIDPSDVRMDFYERFKKNSPLYDIPHTNYLFNTFEENSTFKPD